MKADEGWWKSGNKFESHENIIKVTKISVCRAMGCTYRDKILS